MRKTFVVLLAVLLLLVGAMLSLLVPRKSSVTKEAFGRIEDGMTLAEVEAILGGPPGDYRTEPTAGFVSHEEDAILSEDEVARTGVWQGDEVTVHVSFDGGWLTARKHLFHLVRVDVGPVELMQWRFQRWREKRFGASP